MKVYFSDSFNNKQVNLDIDINKFNKEYNSISIDKFEGFEGKLTLNKVDDILIINFDFAADLILISSYSLTKFPKKLDINETLYFSLTEEDGDIIKTENEIDIDNYLFSLVVTTLPLKLHAPNEKEIKNNGYRVISEDDLNKEEDEVSESPFDVLDNLKL